MKAKTIGQVQNRYKISISILAGIGMEFKYILLQGKSDRKKAKALLNIELIINWIYLDRIIS